MDFDMDSEQQPPPSNKQASLADDFIKDYSPPSSTIVGDGNQYHHYEGGAGDTLLNTSTKASNSSDDFEHIVQEKSDYDFLGGGNGGGGDAGDFVPTTTGTTTLDTHGNLLSDDSFGKTTTATKKLDDFDLLLGMNNPIKTATVDFMAAERHSSPTKTATDIAAAAAAVTQSIYDEIENDYLNPYASKSNEKFISSEDLLGDYKADESSPLILQATESVKKPEYVDTSSADALVQAPIQAPAQPLDFDLPQVIPSKLVEISTPKIEETLPSASPPSPPIKSEIVVTAKRDKPTVISATTPAPSMVQSKPRDQMISAEEIFYRIGLVESLIYWRDPKKSGIVFGAGITILLAISFFSVISVVANVSLLSLLITMAIRIYKNVLQAVQKTSEGHPFKEYMEYELALPQEKVQQIATVSVAHINAFVAELRRLFLVEDLVDSIKFALLLWCLTYLGSWFNGMTLVILGFVALFTLPKVYENNKQSIDIYLDLVRSKVLEITDKVKTAVPIGGKKQESDKDK